MEDNRPVDQRSGMFSSEENTETGDSELDKQASKKSFKRFLKRLFAVDDNPEGETQATDGSEKKHRIRDAIVNVLGLSDEVPEPEYVDEVPDIVENDETNFIQTHGVEHSFSLLDQIIEQEDAAVYVRADAEPVITEATNQPSIEELPPEHSIEQTPIDESPADSMPDEVNLRSQIDRANSRIDELSVREGASEATRPAEKKVPQNVNRSDNGAALLGFVAAETLSRHRDAKIRKEAVTLKKQFERSDKKHTTQEFSIEQRVIQNREQVEDLRHKRNETRQMVRPIESEMPPISVDLVRAERIMHQDSPAERNDFSHQREVVVARAPEVKKDMALDRTGEQLILNQVENAAERDIALEAYYERMHEAKDVPTSGASGSGGGGAGRPVDPVSARKSESHDTQSIASRHSGSASNQKEDDLYATAARRGAWAGVALLAGLLIIAVIWSLFR